MEQKIQNNVTRIAQNKNPALKKLGKYNNWISN